MSQKTSSSSNIETSPAVMTGVRRSKDNRPKRRPFVLAEGMGVTTDGSETVGTGDLVVAADVSRATQHSGPTAAAPGSGGQHIVDKTFNGTGDLANRSLQYLGGPVLSSVQLRLVFWGREWAGTAPPVTMSQVLDDVKSICAGPYFDAAKQLGANGAYVDRVVQITNSDPPNPVTASDAGNLVLGLIDNDTVPEPDDDLTTALYIVLLPQRVGGATLSTPPGLNGAHSYATYSDYDFPVDWDNDSVFYAWIRNTGSRAQISTTVSHEIVEAMTDPMGNGWQVTPTNSSNWNEVGDVCRSTFVLNSVTVQSYWSGKDNSCVVPTWQPDNYQVTWIYKPSRTGHIEWMGGTQANGQTWQMTRNEVMSRVQAGDRFAVEGVPSGTESFVGVYYRDAFHPYLGTTADGIADDNLLALPNRLPL